MASEYRVTARSIALSGFVVVCEIGIHDFERAAPQRVVIDITLDLDPSCEPAAGDLSSTLDYDFLRERIFALVAGRRFPLQEDLCRHILDICMSPPEVTAATVRTAKPDVYPDCEAVSYRLSAVRS